MTLRFQRRIRLAPWLHLTLSRSGVSASIGPRGLDVNSRTGLNVGIPGTGLRWTQRLCPTCNGAGWCKHPSLYSSVVTHPCLACDKTGAVASRRYVALEIFAFALILAIAVGVACS